MNDSENKIPRESFKESRDYRHGYVDEFLNAYIATQIKVLREKRGWSQKELGEHAGMMQPRISVMENVNYSSWSIKILRKIAEAFDLTLCVSFESFSKRIKDIEQFSRATLERNQFDQDPYFMEESKEKYATRKELESTLGTGGPTPTDQPNKTTSSVPNVQLGEQSEPFGMVAASAQRGEQRHETFSGKSSKGILVGANPGL